MFQTIHTGLHTYKKHIFSKKSVDFTFEVIYNTHTIKKGTNQMTFNTAMQASLVLAAYLGFITLAMISTSIS